MTSKDMDPPSLLQDGISGQAVETGGMGIEIGCYLSVCIRPLEAQDGGRAGKRNGEVLEAQFSPRAHSGAEGLGT